ncbi:MAG: PAS domain-containing protein, partial [Clostridia bacterium]|nr:PAS domain-containing protein [Clostridia bacterium]
MTARNKYKKIFDVMNLAVIIVENYKVIDANEEAIHLLCKKKERVLNSSLLELLGMYENDLKAKGALEISLNDGYKKKQLSVQTVALEEEVEKPDNPT